MRNVSHSYRTKSAVEALMRSVGVYKANRVVSFSPAPYGGFVGDLNSAIKEQFLMDLGNAAFAVALDLAKAHDKGESFDVPEAMEKELVKRAAWSAEEFADEARSLARATVKVKRLEADTGDVELVG